MRTLSAAFVLAVVFGISAASVGIADAGALILERKISLGNVLGRIDHMAIDISGKRLFIAEFGNNSVDIVDLLTGKTTHRIDGLKEPQGVAYVPDQDLLVVTNGGDGSVRFFHAAEASPLETIDLRDDADNVRIDPTTRHILIGYGGGGLAVIDAARRSKIGDIKLAGHPESFQVDPKTDRAYVNVPDAHQIAVVDLASGKQISTWRISGLGANFPMAFVGRAGPLAVAFRSPPTLALLDPRTGKVRERLETCADADDVFVDRKRDRVYVTCGDGSINVVQQSAQGFRPTGRIPTADGARTSLFVAELDRLVVAAPPSWPGSQASLLVFRPTP